MQSFSFRWMKRSPRGLAQSVTSPLHLSSSLLMGKEMRACFHLSRPCSFVSKFLKFVLCNFEYLYVMPVWGTSLKLQRCFRDSWYKLNHAPTCTAFFFFFLFGLVWKLIVFQNLSFSTCCSFMLQKRHLCVSFTSTTDNSLYEKYVKKKSNLQFCFWTLSAALTNTSYCSKDWKLCATYIYIP